MRRSFLQLPMREEEVIDEVVVDVYVKAEGGGVAGEGVAGGGGVAAAVGIHVVGAALAADADVDLWGGMNR